MADTTYVDVSSPRRPRREPARDSDPGERARGWVGLVWPIVSALVTAAAMGGAIYASTITRVEAVERRTDQIGAEMRETAMRSATRAEALDSRIRATETAGALASRDIDRMAEAIREQTRAIEALREAVVRRR